MMDVIFGGVLMMEVIFSDDRAMMADKKPLITVVSCRCSVRKRHSDR